MGVGGTIGYLSSILRRKTHKPCKKQLQTIELKINMDCDGCELKVKRSLSSLRGVKRVEINRKLQKVAVTGYIDAATIIERAKRIGKKAEIWPYVPYNLVAKSCIAHAYDKKAPPGYVRNMEESTAVSSTMAPIEGSYLSMFSDDNPNACLIM